VGKRRGEWVGGRGGAPVGWGGGGGVGATEKLNGQYKFISSHRLYYGKNLSLLLT